MFRLVLSAIFIVWQFAKICHIFARKCRKSAIYFCSIFSIIAQLFLINPALAEEVTPQSDVRVGLYFNYYLPSYTNTPLWIRRQCTCQLGYQSGVTIQDRLFWRTWFNFHGYVMGESPSLAQSPEQYGTRFEIHIRFDRFTFLIGHHNEWDIYHSSDFPIDSKKGNYVSTGGLRETYIGLTWWVY